MNRIEEYENIMQELDSYTPESAPTCEKAWKRYRHRRYVIRACQSIMLICVMFVFVVNVSAPVAMACSKIPILRDVTEAVLFSPSLTKAVENDYAQPIGLVQRDGDVEATIGYVIVDQKQINVLFSLESKEYTYLNAYPRVLSADGMAPPPCSYGVYEWNGENGAWNTISIDFVNDDVPSSIRLKLGVLGEKKDEQTENDAPSEGSKADEIENLENEYIASFDFLLEFDPDFTEKGECYPVDKEIILNDQIVVIDEVEIYPSHMRINVSDHPSNSALLKAMDFYVENEKGERYEPIKEGIISTGSEEGTFSMTSFRADSAFFYENTHLKLVITGTEWLKKDMETVYVNMKTGETDPLPDGVSFYSAKRENDDWILSFEAEYVKDNHTRNVFYSECQDDMGEVYAISSWTDGLYDSDKDNAYVTTMYLNDYDKEEVWLKPCFSESVTVEKPVEILIK